jgi:hypothetical protein
MKAAPLHEELALDCPGACHQSVEFLEVAALLGGCAGHVVRPGGEALSVGAIAQEVVERVEALLESAPFLAQAGDG